MSEVEHTSIGVATGDQRNNRPAVGILATGENSDAVAGAMLRARAHGFEPLVVTTDGDSEAVGFATHLGISVLEVTDPVDSSGLWDRLASAARESGFPGLIKHDSLTRSIDFEASLDALSDADSYLVEPVLAAEVSADAEVLVAIPAYNEASTIGDVVRGAKDHANHVVVIDDGSSDDTVDEAVEAGATVIEHATNKGYGGALKTAFCEAKRADVAHLVILDGDGQHDPTDIPELVECQRTRDADIVIGSRFEKGSDTEMPLYRRLGLRVVNTLTNLSLGVVRKKSRIADTQSGFRAYNREAIASLATDEDVGNNMGASTDILYHAHHHGYDVEEVGTTIDYDVDEASSQNPVSHGLQLVQNILRTVERERPVTVLGVPGFTSAVIGVGFGYLTFSNFLNSGTFPLGLALTSVFFALAGIFAAFTAIILHSLETHLK